MTKEHVTTISAPSRLLPEALDCVADAIRENADKELQRLGRVATVCDTAGRTLAHKFYDEPLLLDLVLQRGAPVNAPAKLLSFDYVAQKNLAPDTAGQVGVHPRRRMRQLTPLHLAAKFGTAEACEVLLRHGADVHAPGSTGETPLFGAVDNVEKLECLVRHGADINAQAGAYVSGKTVLHQAASEGRIECVELLLEHGAGMNQLDDEGKSALLAAKSKHDNSAVIIRLIKHAQQTGGACARWSRHLLPGLLANQPIDTVMAYLDMFTHETQERNCFGEVVSKKYAFRQLHLIYGPPWDHLMVSPLFMIIFLCVFNSKVQEVLMHPAIKYVVDAKWQAFGRTLWCTQLLLFLALLVSTFLAFLSDDQPTAVVSRVISLVLCSFFLILEALDLRTKPITYLISFTNYLNLAADIMIMVVCCKTMSAPIDHTLYMNEKAIALVLLTFCAIEHMRIMSLTGLLIAMMEEMLSDVIKFLALYMVFQVAFSGAFFVLFRDNPDGATQFGTYSRSFVSTFFMLFGEVNSDIFLDGKGSTGTVATVLVIMYLLGAMVVLLNILIAMMSTSYEQVYESAKCMQTLARADLVLRMEALLPHRHRVDAYDRLIPDCQPEFKYAASRARYRAARKTIDGSADSNVTDVEEGKSTGEFDKGKTKAVPDSPLEGGVLWFHIENPPDVEPEAEPMQKRTVLRYPEIEYDQFEATKENESWLGNITVKHKIPVSERVQDAKREAHDVVEALDRKLHAMQSEVASHNAAMEQQLHDQDKKLQGVLHMVERIATQLPASSH